MRTVQPPHLLMFLSFATALRLSGDRATERVPTPCANATPGLPKPTPQDDIGMSNPSYITANRIIATPSSWVINKEDRAPLWCESARVRHDRRRIATKKMAPR